MVSDSADTAGTGNNTEAPRRMKELGGQRRFSALIYLNSAQVGDFEGGSTAFPLLGNLTLDPPARSMVFWRNVDHANEVDPRTLHEGRVVTAGRKLAINVWVLEDRFQVYRDAAPN